MGKDFGFAKLNSYLRTELKSELSWS